MKEVFKTTLQSFQKFISFYNLEPSKKIKKPSKIKKNKGKNDARRVRRMKEKVGEDQGRREE